MHRAQNYINRRMGKTTAARQIAALEDKIVQQTVGVTDPPPISEAEFLGVK